MARPFEALRPSTWERVDHLQPRSSGFEGALERALQDLEDRLADGRLAPTSGLGAGLLWIDEAAPGLADGETEPARRTAGVILALDVTQAGRDAVLPHERTFPEPVARRVRTRNTLGIESVPTLVVLRDSVEALTAILDEFPVADLHRRRGGLEQSAAWLDGGPSGGSAPGRLSALVATLSGTPALVADGHHRVTAALDPAARAHGTVMAWLTAAEHPPRLLPVHRQLRRVPTDLTRRLELAGIMTTPVAAQPHPEACVLVTSEGAQALHAAPGSPAARALSELPTVIRDLPVALGQHVLHDVLGLGVRRDQVRTTTDPAALVAEVASAGAQAGLLACGPSLDEVWRAAEAGVLMPPKATWFAPKPSSGSVLRILEPLPKEAA